MKIKVLEKTPGCLPFIIKKGEWVDLRLAEEVKLKAPQANKMHIRNKSKEDVETIRTRDVDFDFYIALLGVAMQLPDGFEAIVVPRSSTFKKWGVTVPNSFGVIDNSYRGNKDEWKVPLLAFRKTTIPKGTAIAQFRIQLSQKATMWQKIKWLFSSSIKIESVPFLDNPNRGGFGTTGN